MERPSHIIFDRHQSFSRRAPLFVLAIGLQLAGAWLFIHGLASHLPNVIHDFQFVVTHEKQVSPATPPEPKIQTKLKPPAAIKPEFTIEPPAKGGGGPRNPPPGGDTGNNPPQENVIHAAVGILSTHTVPPYPPVARRIGAEGKVTLRLTVSAEGRVTQTEIVTSSGRDELDHAAQAWIEAHWTYKPALENGVPVIGHVLAAVTFSLATER